MMNKIKFTLAFWATVLWWASAFTQAAMPVASLSAKSNGNNYAFQPGERLTYKVYYNWNFVWLAAGEVTFEVNEDDRQYHFRAVGNTYESYEWFYQVHDVYNSWTDKNTLLPRYSERSIHEGNYRIFERIQFDQSNRKATVWRATRRGDPETRTEHGVQERVFDVLSSLYYLRTLDFSDKAAGAEHPFRIFMDQEEYPLRMRYLGKEKNTKIRGLGRFNTMKFQPQVVVGNIFSDDSKMTVWVSDDENRIPLLLETPIAVGSVKMVLKEHKNLKYPLSSKKD